MADNSIEGAVLGNGLTGLTSSTDEVNDSIQGLHELQLSMEDITKEYYKKSQKAFEDIEEYLKVLAGGEDKEEGNKFNFDLASLGGGSDKDVKEGAEESAKDKKSAGKLKNNIKLDELVKYNDSSAATGVILHNDFQELFKTLKNGDGGKKKGGLGDLFGDLAKGALGLVILAGALVAFAAAAALFNFVDWGKALLGLVMFTGFVVGSILLANLVKPQINTFKDFALGILMMTAAYAAFSLTLLLVSWISKHLDLKGILVTLSLFAAFVVGTLILAIQLKSATGDLVQFALGSMLMAAAYLAFSVSLVLVSFLSKYIDIKSIIPTLGLFMIFVVVTGAIAALVGAFKGNFVQFAVGSILMSVAFVAFAGAMWVLTKFLPMDIMASAIIKIAIITTIIVLLGALASTCLVPMAGAIVFSAVLLIFSVSLAASAAMFLLAMMAINAIKITPRTFLNITSMGIVMLTFAALGPIALVATVGSALFTAWAIVTLPAVLSFLGVVTLLDKLNMSKEHIKSLQTTVGGLGKVILAFIPLGAAALLGMASAALFTAWAILTLPSILSLMGVIKMLDSMKLDSSHIAALEVTLGGLNDVIHLICKTLHVSVIDTIKIAGFAASSLIILGAVTSAMGILSMVKKMANMKIKPEEMTQVMANVTGVVSSLGDMAESVKGLGIKTALAMSIALDGITKSIGNIADVILKIMSIKPEEVDQANANIKLILNKLFVGSGDLSNPTLSDVLESLPGISKSALRGAEALVPVTAALGNLTDTIQKVSGLEGKIDPAIESLKKEAIFLQDLTGILQVIAGESTYGKNIFGRGGKNTFEEAQKSLSSIQEVLEQMSGLPLDKVKNISELPATLGTFVSFDGKMFSNNIKDMEEGLSRLSKVNFEGLKIVEASNKININNLNATARAFSSMGSQAAQLKSVATSMTEIANASKKLNHKGLLSSLDGLDSIHVGQQNTGNGQTVQSNAPGIASKFGWNNNDRDTLGKMFDILEAWDKDGFKFAKDVSTSTEPAKNTSPESATDFSGGNVNYSIKH
jgi:hypothetical protein